MASNNLLSVPQPLEIRDSQAAEKLKCFKRAWTSYTLATELDTKAEKVQLATLLTVIGEEAREVFTTFSWNTAGDKAKIEQNLNNIASLTVIHLLKDTVTVLTIVCKSQGSPMISTVLLC